MVESASSDLDLALPQKRNYRQRAHSNPIADHCLDYPSTPDNIDWSLFYPDFDPNTSNGVEFLDIGCGYGGLLVELSQLFPETLMLGINDDIFVCNQKTNVFLFRNGDSRQSFRLCN